MYRAARFEHNSAVHGPATPGRLAPGSFSSDRPDAVAAVGSAAACLPRGTPSRNLNPALWVSADAYYNIGGETSIDRVSQHNAANTLRLGAGLGLSVWAGGDVTLNYDHVVAKPAGQPDAQAVGVTVRQVW